MAEDMGGGPLGFKVQSSRFRVSRQAGGILLKGSRLKVKG
jgi:hypothetical protein